MKKVISTILALLCVCIIICSCEAKDKSGDANHTKDTEIGTGNTEFIFEVEHLDGKKVVFTVRTDKTSLADALLENNLIAGDDSAYGLYVKAVDGVEYDYARDKAYWSLYIDDKLSDVGVSSVTIDPMHTYKFKAEKAQ